MVVSFGTSYNESRELTIGAFDNAIGEAYPDYEVRRAFTSQMIINKLKKRDGIEIDNVKEAAAKAVADGVQTLIVQPTHLMDGFEYMELIRDLEGYRNKFGRFKIAAPLLSSDEDFRAVIKAIVSMTAEYDDGNTAICFMGHGTGADANAVYPRLQKEMMEAGYRNYYIGTVEAAPTLEDLIVQTSEKKDYKRVVLQPLMVVAGDHAHNDMAGEEEDSWKQRFEAEGYEVECVIRGLGEFPAIREIYVAHTKSAIDD